MDFFPISCSLLPLQRRTLQEQSVHFTSELVSTCLRFNNSDLSLYCLFFVFKLGCWSVYVNAIFCFFMGSKVTRATLILVFSGKLYELQCQLIYRAAPGGPAAWAETAPASPGASARTGAEPSRETAQQGFCSEQRSSKFKACFLRKWRTLFFRFGVCCIFILQSGGTITQNCTYIQNAGFPGALTDTSNINYSVQKCSDGMRNSNWKLIECLFC